MIRVDTRPRKRNAPRLAAKDAPGFLQYLRGRPCVVCGSEGPIEAAHVDYAGKGTPLAKGKDSKVADRFAIPMCGGPSGCHATQTRLGWKRFEQLHNFSGEAVSKVYWRAWPGRIAWERKLNAS